MILPPKFFENNIARLRAKLSKEYGLNIFSNRRGIPFNKRFGLPNQLHWRVGRIRRFERPAKSRRKTIKPIQKFNDCLLLPKIRSIIDTNYTFGISVKKLYQKFFLKRQQAATYQYIRFKIGLPCHGQRTKTNSNTSKKNRNISDPETLKFLNLYCKHQSIGLLRFAKELHKKRESMQKFRMIRELQNLRRYRPPSSVEDVEEHYEKIYENIIEKRKRRINRR